MINRVVLVGRMTRDPELRRTQNGSAVTSFTLAINRPKRNDEEQQADYISCVVWNKTAENVESTVLKVHWLELKVDFVQDHMTTLKVNVSMLLKLFVIQFSFRNKT